MVHGHGIDVSVVQYRLAGAVHPPAPCLPRSASLTRAREHLSILLVSKHDCITFNRCVISELLDPIRNIG